MRCLHSKNLHFIDIITYKAWSYRTFQGMLEMLQTEEKMEATFHMIIKRQKSNKIKIVRSFKNSKLKQLEKNQRLGGATLHIVFWGFSYLFSTAYALLLNEINSLNKF